jgi:hypothetical protein
MRYDHTMTDQPNRTSSRRPKSHTQERERALRLLSQRRDFLGRLIEKRQAAGDPVHLEAAERSALAWVIEQLSASHYRDVTTDAPPAFLPCTLTCDAGMVIGERRGDDYYCKCGNPATLTGVTLWTVRPAPPPKRSR